VILLEKIVRSFVERKVFYRLLNPFTGNVFYAIEYLDGWVKELRDAPWNSTEETGNLFSLNQLQRMPVCLPSQILAFGLNYRDHAQEMGEKLPEEPVLFMKAASALTGDRSPIICPPQSKRVDYEAELGVIIGKETGIVSPEEAAESIFGYCCINDVTARDLQKKDGQWIRAKSFRTFCPAGPCIVSGIDAGNLDISLTVNGCVKQQSNTRNLIFSPAMLVSFISQIMPLHPGDLIATGTPSGIGPLSKGDQVSVTIESIGTLTNHVV